MAYTSKQRVIAKGTGDIYIADPVVGGKISDAEWENIMVSLKGSFTITQEEGDTTTVEIDQSDLPVLSETQPGNLTISWNAPNTSKAMWELLYNTVASMESIYTGSAGEEVIGVRMNTKEIKKMLKVKMRVGGSTYVFPNLQWPRLFMKDSDDDPTYFTITCTVLAAVDTLQPDFIVINQMDGSAD